jgi:ABC-type phosphate/phosphonate transport system substrate-binding protein
MTLLLGAVAYDPKVVTIWEGFRSWFREQGLDVDFILYSNYERQVEELVAGRLDVAWNSPLAWVRSRRLAESSGVSLRPITMRDTDCDLTSVIVVRADSSVQDVSGLRGLTVATGAVDSPQGTLIPLQLLGESGLRAGQDFAVRRFDIGVGLHGDHIGGERDAARALAQGEVDAACMIDSNLLLFTQEGTLPADARVIGRTARYDHCLMTANASADAAELDRFADLLLGMAYSDPVVRHLLDLEGLKEWRPPRLEGFAQLERAVNATGFYDETGKIGAGDYRP